MKVDNVYDYHSLINEEEGTKTIMKAMFNLTRKDLINSLHYDFILIYGKYYYTPESQILNILKNRMEGAIELELTQYETKDKKEL